MSEREEWIVSPHHGRWILWVSLLIPVSAAHATYRSLYMLAAADILGFLTTINYWRRPVCGIRRTTDIVCILFAWILHIWWAWSCKHWWTYVGLVSCGATIYPVSYLVQWAGYTDTAMACHVVLHGVVFVSNNLVYIV
jgi:hypothetical protein